ncbi:YfjI family protein [Sphaerotilus uruguayifluvii]|uniref:DUF3987 domain-containing protein n=1 Tax=Sphaerotilus uruguayifluvii TaxID=2735897 RepID=A0ABX2GA75_9BURK|nr:YfjI family protein [Leptothrix sp. C29]NRT58400.1 hypothetical protein [Leptothrix sp. C29]
MSTAGGDARRPGATHEVHHQPEHARRAAGQVPITATLPMYQHLQPTHPALALPHVLPYPPNTTWQRACPVDPDIQKLTDTYGHLPNPDNYPWWWFPPELGRAVMDVAYRTEAPLALVGASALGALSLSQQAHLDVQTPHGSIEPCALYLITLGKSGERKTTCDQMFTRELRAVHDRLHEKSFLEYEEYQRVMKARKRQRSEAALEPEPQKPKVIDMISSNATPAAILNSLHEFSPFGSLMSDEAGTVLDGPATPTPYLFNELWDGHQIEINRKSTGPIKIKSPRFTMSLMLQPEVFAKFNEKQNNLAERSGLLPRSLVSYPTSTQGHRGGEDRSHLEQGIKPLQQRLGSWLEQSWLAFVRAEPRRVVSCTPDAARTLKEFTDTINNQVRPGGRYSQITAFASKAGSHALRMAALFSQFQEDNSVITEDSIYRATCFVNWYIEQYLALLGPTSPAFQAAQDVQRMLGFIDQACRQFHSPLLTYEFVVEYAHPQFGSKSKVKTVLNLLETNGTILIGPNTQNGQKTIACLFLDPNSRGFIGAPQAAQPSQTRSVRASPRRKPALSPSERIRAHLLKSLKNL